MTDAPVNGEAILSKVEMDTMNREKERRPCRHGLFSYFPDDMYVGRSLAKYGEYSEGEAITCGMILRPGDVCIDVGANIGTLTVVMSKLVGKDGCVIAFEASPENFALLRENMLQNNCTNVIAHNLAAASELGRVAIPSHEELGHTNFGRIETGRGGLTARKAKIDDLDLPRCKFIKMDIEGNELDALKGAEKTLDRCRPILYIENDREELSAPLVAWLVDHGYRPYWHRPPLYNPQNFDGNQMNVFGGIISMMMLCVHEESGIEVRDLDEVADLRQIDEHVYDREINRYARYAERKPDDITPILMMAHYHNLMQRRDKARELIAQCYKLDMTHIPTMNIEGMMMLQDGEWQEGWKRYELRLFQRNKIYMGAQRNLSGAHWDGQPTDDVVLISAEQGFGDQIMFARFYREVLRRAPNAIFECHPSLYELFQTSHIAPRHKLYIRDRSLPEYQQHCSSPSLPAALGISKDEEIECEPYLRADNALVKRWIERRTARIGLCWAGSPRSERPFTRDIPLPLVERFIGEQGPFHNLANSEAFENFADTAACISQLDLVVTVDTAVAHLAGSLGVPTWLLLSFDPDFRWGLTSDRTLWYPSMRIIRQKKLTDWPEVLERLSISLHAFRAGMEKISTTHPAITADQAMKEASRTT